MKIELLNAKQVGNKLQQLMNKENDFHWAVAWATEMPFAEALLNNKNKIRHLVIGTDFAQTSPDLLHKLKNVKNVHVMISKGGTTFHPKVYCFVDDEKVSAIVGSANFTNGGTNSNDEASLFIEGSVDDKPIQDILDSVSSWWSGGKEIDEEFLTVYKLRWLANKKHKKAIEKPLVIYRPKKDSANPALLITSWADYINNIKNKPGSEIDVRLAVLQQARQLLNSRTSFHQLDELQRKAIAGTIGSNEILGSELEGLDWGWFGRMSGAGDFNNRIIENDRHLSAALEQIPSIGEVTEDDYARFSAEFLRAFTNSTRNGGIATASRLLAMKRPDYFVCVNSKNETGLGADIGFSHSTLKLNNYWERVVEPITQARWWNVNRPEGKNGRIWDARAAMLDVIYMD